MISQIEDSTELALCFRTCGCTVRTSPLSEHNKRAIPTVVPTIPGLALFSLESLAEHGDEGEPSGHLLSCGAEVCSFFDSLKSKDLVSRSAVHNLLKQKAEHRASAANFIRLN